MPSDPEASNAKPASLPVGVAIWAKVSAQVDAKLTAQKLVGAPYRLKPTEWVSGNIPWLVATYGPPQIVVALRKQIDELFDGRAVKDFRQVADAAAKSQPN